MNIFLKMKLSIATKTHTNENRQFGLRFNRFWISSIFSLYEPKQQVSAIETSSEIISIELPTECCISTFDCSYESDHMSMKWTIESNYIILTRSELIFPFRSNSILFPRYFKWRYRKVASWSQKKRNYKLHYDKFEGTFYDRHAAVNINTACGILRPDLRRLEHRLTFRSGIF